MEKHTNRLIGENSPYLLQHAHNPVDWLPWGEEALDMAIKAHKLIFVSIGYASCHWCHVMERESFENKAIAELLNNNFVCIKVDRQERPDIDQVYMSAVQLMSGNGGWPLNCFATPEAKPFYGGTYFPPSQLKDIILQLKDIWSTTPQKINKAAESLYDGIANSELVKNRVGDFDNSNPKDIYKSLSEEFDPEEGGMKRVPKFPMPGIYRYILHFYHYSGFQPALDHAILTTSKIIRGGIYDQLDGGIARYSTDRKWIVPHFEKMLYDNAQFISLLSELFALTGNTLFRRALSECTGFLENEMTGKSGGFYSSMDADSGNEEGKYYAWDAVEIDEIAGSDSGLVKSYWGVTKNGNWEDGKNVLAATKTTEELSALFDVPAAEIVKIIAKISKKLNSYRKQREKPTLDTKILTSWNSLMVKAYAEAWQATGEQHYYDSALMLGQFIRMNLVTDASTVKRSLKGNTPGFLDDYAFTIDSFLLLYQISFEEDWLKLSEKIIEQVIQEFFNHDTGMFHYASAKQSDLVIRQTDVTDNVIPSSNSVFAHALFLASRYFDNEMYAGIARQMVQNIIPYLRKAPSFFSGWAKLSLLMKQGPKEVVITGPDFKKSREGFTGKYLPDVIFAGAEEHSSLSLFHERFVKGQNRIYVCHDGTCKLPVSSAGQALEQI